MLKRTRQETAKQLMVNTNHPMNIEAANARVLPGVGVQFAGAGLLGGLTGAVLAWGLVGEWPAVIAGGLVYLGVMGVALVGLRAQFPHPVIGLCNVATMGRLVLVAVLIAALIAVQAPPWGVFTIALVAFGLDGLDGWLARRSGWASDFGARFDMEVDSILALVLALLAWQNGAVGAYVILLGLPRYGFWIAQFPFPWLNGTLPERFSRKVVCVVQISALILALVPGVSPLLAGSGVGVAAVGLIWSFWRDVRHLRAEAE